MIYFLLAAQCCLLNCSLMVQSSFKLLNQIISYDATKLKNVVKFYVSLGPFSLVQSRMLVLLIH